MKKNMTASCVDQLNISPISVNSKHQMTPLRTRRKMSRKDQSADVHATCSTPNRPQGGIQYNGFNSPPDSFPFSQENRPDVIWDYTSPKLPKGSKKKDIKITVDEFLKNLTHQVPESNTHSSHYIKLLEKWMTKQNTPVIKKPLKNVKRDNKKRSRRVIEEIKEFMESIQNKNEDVPAKNKKEQTPEDSFPKPECSSNVHDKKSFLEGNSNENDSTDDLWGEMDNSFIIKATQQLDVIYSKNNNVLDKNLEIISTIPDTISSTSEGVNSIICELGQNTKVNCLNKAIIDSNYQDQTTVSSTSEGNNNANSAMFESRKNTKVNYLGKAIIDSDLQDQIIISSTSEGVYSAVFESKQNTTSNPLDKVIDSDYQAQILLTQIINCDWESGSDNEDWDNGFIEEDEALSLIPDEVLSGADPKHEENLSSAAQNADKKCESLSVNNVETAGNSSDIKISDSKNRSEEISFGCSETVRVACHTVDVSEAELFNVFEDDSFSDESILCKPEVLSWMDQVESQVSLSQPKCTPEEIEKKKDEAMRRKRNKSKRKN